MNAGVPILCIAHRGAGRLAPENTLTAIRAALALGVDGIEFDIRSSADGELVLLHDETLDRTTDGTGAVEAWTLADLRTLDAGRWFGPAFAGERIPTLQDALRVIDGRATAYLELRHIDQVERTVDAVRAANAAAWCTCISSSEAVLARCARLMPDTPRAWLVYASADMPVVAERLIPRLSAIPVHMVGLSPSLVNPELLRHFHDAGIRVLTSPLDDEAQMAAFLAMGPDAVVTNRPDVMMRMKNQGQGAGIRRVTSKDRDSSHRHLESILTHTPARRA